MTTILTITAAVVVHLAIFACLFIAARADEGMENFIRNQPDTKL